MINGMAKAVRAIRNPGYKKLMGSKIAEETSNTYFNHMNKYEGKTLVLGASLKSYRYSHLAILKLEDHKYEVHALGLRKGRVGNTTIETEIDAFDGSDIDTFTVYLGAKRQSDLLQWVDKLRPKRVIFNPGAENPNIYPDLEKRGVEWTEACTLVLLGTGQYESSAL